MLIIVLVNAVEQMSLELRLERFQRLTVPDLWWQPVLPVVHTWQNNVVQNPSQLRRRRGHRVRTIAVRFRH